jgi:hypothetical protein
MRRERQEVMARGVARDMCDFAGGIIIGVLAPTVFTNKLTTSVVGCIVEGHAPYPHVNVVVATGSPDVFAHNIPVARVGDVASCGHPIVKASLNVFAN